MKKIIFALAIVAALSGCERLNNAWTALTDYNKDVANQRHSERESDDELAGPAALNDQVPFTIEGDLDSFFGGMQITSVVDRLLVNSVLANRGNCKVQETLKEIELSDLKSNELAIEGLNYASDRISNWRIVSTGEVIQGDIYRVRKQLEQKGLLTPSTRLVVKGSPAGKFHAQRSAFPASIKFGESLSIPLECSADQVIEMLIETDHGSYTWRR